MCFVSDKMLPLKQSNGWVPAMSRIYQGEAYARGTRSCLSLWWKCASEVAKPVRNAVPSLRSGIGLSALPLGSFFGSPLRLKTVAYDNLCVAWIQLLQPPSWLWYTDSIQLSCFRGAHLIRAMQWLLLSKWKQHIMVYTLTMKKMQLTETSIAKVWQRVARWSRASTFVSWLLSNSSYRDKRRKCQMVEQLYVKQLTTNFLLHFCQEVALVFSYAEDI